MKTTTNTTRLNKTQTWEAITTILDNYSKEFKSKKKYEAFASELEQLLAPKNGGGISSNPPKLNENGEITHIWCRWHKTYEPVEEFKTVSKGTDDYKQQDGDKYWHYECKEAENQWKLWTKEIKRLEKEIETIMGNILDDKIDIIDAKLKINDLKKDIEVCKENRSNRIDFN